ncbi:hypothetical protein [Chamaesiphon sp.]|uniref:hypothetical protein n=1 Tax=Chamaesiphon sp. TaxID=2814140 RepID=UPI00359347D5
MQKTPVKELCILVIAVIPYNSSILSNEDPYLQAEQVWAIGSGSVESTIKQIDRRTQISGAQCKSENTALSSIMKYSSSS